MILRKGDIIDIKSRDEEGKFLRATVSADTDTSDWNTIDAVLLSPENRKGEEITIYGFSVQALIG